MSYSRIHDFSTNSDAIVALCFSLNGTYLASGGYHGATIYNLEKDDVVSTPFADAHTPCVSSFGWLRFNDSMAVDILILGTVNGGLIAWRTSESKRFVETDLHMAYDGSEILSIATRQRESCPTWRVATGSRGGTVQVWEVDRLGIMTNIFSKQVKEMIAKTLAYNPSDGGLLVFTLANSAILHLREDNGEMRGVIELNSCVMATASFDSENRLFAVHNVHDGFDIFEFEPAKKIRSLKTGVARNHYPKQVVFCENGQSVVCGTENGAAKIFNVETGACEQILRLRSNLLCHTVASLDLPDKTLIAVGSADVGFENSISVWKHVTDVNRHSAAAETTPPIPDPRRRSQEPLDSQLKSITKSTRVVLFLAGLSAFVVIFFDPHSADTMSSIPPDGERKVDYMSSPTELLEALQGLVDSTSMRGILESLEDRELGTSGQTAEA